ncbi:MAG: tetratricopeptide repeat protein [Rikenellaceae bacterium]|nr:tetratricopeptide repeat protein [Rikenellaceae bacterium]
MAGAGASGQLNKAYFNYIGAVFLNDSKYESAIETLNILLRVDPDAYEAYFLRGVAKYNLDDLLGAEQDFTIAIQKNPVYTLAYRNRAITRSRLGNYDDALKDFQEAIDLRPDVSGAYFSRGVTYFLSQQFESAVEDFNQFLKYETKVADAYINRGLSYLHMKDTVKAYEDFDAAIRTNREDPRGYYFRGTLHLSRKDYEDALLDFDKSIQCDSTYVPPYFNRAIVYANTNRPVQAIGDFDRVLELDSTNSQTYFNRAIIRSQIGDYNRALEDYNMVARYSPGNVLLYYNRAHLYQQLGDLERAVADYNRAIELYPDFANAYLGRAGVKYALGDTRGSRSDHTVAERKIAEYRSKLNDSTFSIYADTSRRFNQLVAFESRMSRSQIGSPVEENAQVKLLPMFRFTLISPDSVPTSPRGRYRLRQLELFREELDNPYLTLTTAESDLPADTLLAYDRMLDEKIAMGRSEWHDLFLRGITQSQIKQYTSSVNTYTEAIDRNPTNAFLYINRATTRSEMIDFISSIDNSFQRLTIDSDPSSRLRNNSTRVYTYDEAIADLNKAAKLLPDFAHIYYNRGILLARSSRMPEAFEDFTRAIELYPDFAEAYFNRGLIQIYMKDTRKGCLDLSKAGELGMREAYEILKEYTLADD